MKRSSMLGLVGGAVLAFQALTGCGGGETPTSAKAPDGVKTPRAMTATDLSNFQLGGSIPVDMRYAPSFEAVQVNTPSHENVCYRTASEFQGCVQNILGESARIGAFSPIRDVCRTKINIDGNILDPNLYNYGAKLVAGEAPKGCDYIMKDGARQDGHTMEEEPQQGSSACKVADTDNNDVFGDTDADGIQEAGEYAYLKAEGLTTAHKILKMIINNPPFRLSACVE